MIEIGAQFPQSGPIAWPIINPYFYEKFEFVRRNVGSFFGLSGEKSNKRK